MKLHVPELRMNWKAIGIAAVFGAAFVGGAFAQGQNDVAMRAMKDELARTMNQIQLENMAKPYFVAYRLDDLRQSMISASLGSLTQDAPVHMRMAGVEIHVGDMTVDNTNYFSARNFGGGLAGILGGIRQAPLDNDYQQIRRAFWMATDAQYKKALEDLSAKRAAIAAHPGTKIPDFSVEPTHVDDEKLDQPATADDDLKKLARDLSAVFKNVPELYASSVDIESRADDARYVNSEGSEFTQPERMIKLEVNAQVQSGDGPPIADSIAFYGHSVADLPAENDLIGIARAMGARVLKLRSAATLDRYNGPVLFEGEAAPEIFAQQFAQGLTAMKTPVSDDAAFAQFFDQMLNQLGGRSFEDRIGGRVLPDFLSVSDNPRLASYKGLKLMGTCSIDDEAVETRETKLVEHGILKTLLATRAPTSAVAHSTGSRRGWGPAPSNLLVTAEKSETQADLRKELLRLVSDRGLQYGIVVRRVGGGSAASFIRMAARMAQQGGEGGGSLAEVYKVFPDGHEEFVQGVEIADMSAKSFRDIVAVGDTPAVYTDDFIPRVGALFSFGASAASQTPVVSYVAPAMLFEELTLVKTEGPRPSSPVGTSPLAK